MTLTPIIMIIIGVVSVVTVGYFILRPSLKKEAHELKLKNNEREGEN